MTSIHLPIKIPDGLRKEILNFVNLNIETSFKKSNPPRKNKFTNEMTYKTTCRVSEELGKLYESISQFVDECLRLMNIQDKFTTSAMFRDMIIKYPYGFGLHTHRDVAVSDAFYHVRINFMIQKPNVGGNPIIMGKEFEIDEGCGWIMLASEWYHSTTVIESNDRDRIILSIGRNIRKRVIDNNLKFDIETDTITNPYFES